VRTSPRNESRPDDQPGGFSIVWTARMRMAMWRILADFAKISVKLSSFVKFFLEMTCKREKIAYNLKEVGFSNHH